MSKTGQEGRQLVVLVSKAGLEGRQPVALVSKAGFEGRQNVIRSARQAMKVASMW